MEQYHSLKHNRTVSTQEQHEISFEFNRRLEGLPGSKLSLALKPECFLDYIRRHVKEIRQVYQPLKTKRGRERYRL